MRAPILLPAIAVVAGLSGAAAQGTHTGRSLRCEAQIACERSQGCSRIRGVPTTFRMTRAIFEDTGQAGYVLEGLGGDRVTAALHDTLEGAKAAAATGQLPPALDAIMIPWGHVAPDFQTWQIYEVDRALRLGGFEYSVLEDRVTKFVCLQMEE